MIRISKFDPRRSHAHGVGDHVMLPGKPHYKHRAAIKSGLGLLSYKSDRAAGFIGRHPWHSTIRTCVRGPEGVLYNKISMLGIFLCLSIHFISFRRLSMR